MRTLARSAAVRLVPRPVTVSSNTRFSGAATAGAAKSGCAASGADSATAVPETWRHAWTTLPPQGPPASPPSVTLAPVSASIPPAGPATATGRNPALPGLPSSVSVASRVSFPKMPSGSDSRSLCSRRSAVSLVSRSNSPAGRAVMRSAAWVWL